MSKPRSDGKVCASELSSHNVAKASHGITLRSLKMRVLSPWFVRLAACVAVVLTLMLTWRTQQKHPCHRIGRPDTLVVHIFADTDPEYLENFRFFVRHGMTPDDTAEYIVVVQTDHASVVSNDFAGSTQQRSRERLCNMRSCPSYQLCPATPATFSIRTSAMTGGPLGGCFCAQGMSHCRASSTS